MEEVPKAGKEETMRVTFLRSFANFILLVLKFVAGIWGCGSTMIADAARSLSDFVTGMIVLLFINISSKPKDKSHDYEHGKYEALAASIVGVVLLCVGFGLFWEGANKIYDFCFKGIPLESPGMIALVTALTSIVTKELLYHTTVWVGRKQNSQVVIANAWHYRSDTLSSIGTALGIGGAILLGDDWRVLNPLAAVIVSLFIVKVTLQLVIPAISDLLERSLPKEVEDEILTIVNEISEVKSPHNLHAHRISDNLAVEVHMRVDGQIIVTRARGLTKEIEQNLCGKLSQTTYITLHVGSIK